MTEINQPLLDGPIAGQSLTAELGGRPWQNPTQYTTVDEAIEYYMERMATEEFMEQVVEVLELGVPGTTIANSIQIASVMEGKHSVDVGMLAIPLIMEMLMLIAENAGVDYDDGLTEERSEQTSDARLELLRQEMKGRIKEVEEEPEVDEPTEEPKGLMARRA